MTTAIGSRTTPTLTKLGGRARRSRDLLGSGEPAQLDQRAGLPRTSDLDPVPRGSEERSIRRKGRLRARGGQVVLATVAARIHFRPTCPPRARKRPFRLIDLSSLPRSPHQSRDHYASVKASGWLSSRSPQKRVDDPEERDGRSFRGPIAQNLPPEPSTLASGFNAADESGFSQLR
jgi:hypothetical protein